MNKEDILGYIIIVLVLFISYKIYIDSDIFQLKCIVSDVDGDKYCVRERKNIKNASNLLAITTDKMKKLVVYVDKKYDSDNVALIIKKYG